MRLDINSEIILRGSLIAWKLFVKWETFKTVFPNHRIYSYFIWYRFHVICAVLSIYVFRTFTISDLKAAVSCLLGFFVAYSFFEKYYWKVLWLCLCIERFLVLGVVRQRSITEFAGKITHIFLPQQNWISDIWPMYAVTSVKKIVRLVRRARRRCCIHQYSNSFCSYMMW